VAGKAAVEDLAHLQRSREVVWDFKKRCYEEFNKMGLEYIPTQGTFIMVNLKRESAPIVREMRKRNVMISNRRQEEFKNWIRVSAGTMDETEVFLQTLKDVMTAAS
jgi:histidinol-phosphate aminotransferase